MADIAGRSEAQRAHGAMLMDYTVPTALDALLEINPLIIEHPEPSGPFRASGVVKSGLIAAPANALAKAAGERVRRLRMTPEGVLNVLIGES